jgi:hypothetical protein
VKKSSLTFGIIFLLLAVVVFIFADGLRRFYSGGFFLILALILFASSRILSALADRSSSQPKD